MRIAPNISNLIIHNPTSRDMIGLYLTAGLCILLVAYVAWTCANRKKIHKRIPRMAWAIIAVCYVITMGVLLNNSVINANKAQYALIAQSYTFPMADAISMLPAPQSNDAITLTPNNANAIDLRTAISEQIDGDTQTIRFTIVPKPHSHNRNYILRVSANNTQDHNDYILTYNQFIHLIDHINQTNIRIHATSHHHINIIAPVDEQAPPQ